MTAYLTVQFTPPELNWLQVNLQAFNEEKWAQMGNSDENHAIGGFQEHGWLQDMLMKVRMCIANPHASVIFTDIHQLNFIKKWFTDYKNNAGEYIFQGPYGTNIQEGGQFPTGTGSANQDFTAQGGFPDQFFQRGANIFNDILHRLGNVVYPPVDPVIHSNGGV